MQPSFFLKLMVFLLTVFCVFCMKENKRNPAPSIGPVKYEIIGKYIIYLAIVYTDSESANTTITFTFFPWSKELTYFGIVKG